MHDNDECVFNYNSLFCHSCLSSNRKLTMVGDYVDIYRKICDSSLMTITPQVKVCWECLALLRKIRAFKKKVDNVQKILDYVINKQAPIRANLSQLKVSQIRTTAFVPTVAEEGDKLTEDDDTPVDVESIEMEPMDYEELPEIWNSDMFQIVDVRGQVDVNPSLPVKTIDCDVTVKCERVSADDSEIANSAETPNDPGVSISSEAPLDAGMVPPSQTTDETDDFDSLLAPDDQLVALRSQTPGNLEYSERSPSPDDPDFSDRSASPEDQDFSDGSATPDDRRSPDCSNIPNDLGVSDWLATPKVDVPAPAQTLEIPEVPERPESPIECTEVVVVCPETEAERQYVRWKRTVMLMFRRLCNHQYAHHFSRPISDELAPHYSRCVKRPMDLATIKRRVQTGVVRTTAEFQRDLLLMFSNALMYNSSRHIIHHMTRQLREEATREMSLLLSSFEKAAHLPRHAYR